MHGVMRMYKLRDHLSDDEIKKLKAKKKEKLSMLDVMELMGVNRQTYKRGKGGAIRRK